MHVENRRGLTVVQANHSDDRAGLIARVRERVAVELGDPAVDAGGRVGSARLHGGDRLEAASRRADTLALKERLRRLRSMYPEIQVELHPALSRVVAGI